MTHPRSPHRPPHPGHVSSRREFLHRGLQAGAAIALTGGLGAWLWNRHPPGDFNRRAPTTLLPDFSLKDSGRQMSLVTGTDRPAMLRRGLDAMGGLERFIKQGDRVMLKVNAAFATPAILSATSNPELVAELIRLCLAAGASSVLVTDNPINDPESCFNLTGLAPAVRAAGAELIVPRASQFMPGTLPGGRLIRDWPVLHGPFRGVTKLIGVAPVKHHNRAGASMTMKNWYGLLGGRRNQFHQDINGIIVELAMMVRPTFVVLDGTTSMMTNGPTGGSLADLKATNTLIVSTDPVAADAFGATLLGQSWRDLPYLGRAVELGIGTADFESLRPERDAV
ncbi:MAG: DUF362 domain-containing protein [Opitutaceae bacterium]|nr:DUF362 domain-containing protein [Opitutaceae bacterium]